MARIIISFFLLIASLHSSGQVYPTITITSDKSVITIGETINFTASISGGGTLPKLEWKKNGVIVGSNAVNFSDNTLKDGDKIACVLTSNDPQRVMNVVASNFLSPSVNPVQINPTLSGEGIVGKAITLNSNATEKVVWKKDGVQIPNPINGFLGNGVSIAGGENSNIDLKSPTGIFFESNSNTLYVLDQTRVLKFMNNSLIGNIIIEQLNNSNDIWVDRDGKIYILSSFDIKIFEPGSSIPNNIIQIQGSSARRFFITENGSIYISSTTNVIEKYDPNSKLFVTVAGTKNVRGSTNSLLDSPEGIFVNSKNEIFVADYNNHRIVKWIEGENSGQVVAGGNGQSVYSNNNFDNKLSWPTDLSVDKNENIYVIEFNSARVTKWEPNKISSIVLGGNGQGTALNKLSYNLRNFKLINDVFYINDLANKRVLKWKIGDAQSTLIAGNIESNSFLFTPWDIKLNNGELYIADRFYYRIQKWDLKANKGTTFLTFGTNPNYLAFDKLNNLYISDNGNNMIKKWQNNFISIYAGTLTNGNSLKLLNRPQGIKFDRDYFLFIVDSGNNRILKWPFNSNEGILVAGNGNNGNSSLELNNPIDIEIDNNDNYYVLDSGNNRIQKFFKNDPNGITIFGLNVPIGNNLLLNKPTGLYLNSKNELIITDKNNHRILKFNPSNLTTTIIAGGTGGGIGSNQLYLPNKAIEDSDGNLIVADSQNDRIQKFTIENNRSFIPTTPGNYTATVTTQFGEFTTPIYKILAQDTDKDGVEDSSDKCPNTPSGEQVDSNGCSLSQKDTDNDGVNDKIDKCSTTKTGFKVDANGCADYQKDSDNDGITDDIDKCQGTPSGIKVDTFGCSDAQKDTCTNVKPIIILKNGLELSTPLIGVGYNWYLNEIKIPNANTSSYLATSSGRYSVQVLKTATCITGVSENIFVQITGTTEENNQFIVFPNPFTKDIKIEFPPEYGSAVKVSISDIKGSIVYSKERVINSEIINLSVLNTGVYFLTIYLYNSSEKRVFKLLKE